MSPGEWICYLLPMVGLAVKWHGSKKGAKHGRKTPIQTTLALREQRTEAEDNKTHPSNRSGTLHIPRRLS